MNKNNTKIKTPSNNKPFLSVIIPALNEEKYIKQLLESLKKQTYKNFEIIVADAGSKDRTVEIAKKYGAKVVKGGIPSVGRNAGAKVAKGEILVFIDADLIVPPQFLKQLVKDFQKPIIDLVILKFKVAKLPNENFGPWKHFWGTVNSTIENFYRSIEYKLNKMIMGTGSMAVRKNIFEQVGGFNNAIKYGEDNDFILRVIKLQQRKIQRTKNKKDKKDSKYKKDNKGKPHISQNYTFSSAPVLASYRRFTRPGLIISGWLLGILFLLVEILSIFKAYKLRAKIRHALMSLFYGELGGQVN